MTNVQPSPPAPRCTRVWFICSCGQAIYDDYAEVTLGGVGKKQKLLRILSIRGRYYKTTSSNTETRGIMNMFKGLFTSYNAPIENTSLPRQQRRSSNAGVKSQNICTTHPLSDPDGHRYIHWCIPWTRYTMRMHSLQTCQIYSDFDFFTALKARYGNSKSRFRHFLSLKKPISLRFVKFQLYHKQLVDIHEAANIPPESRKDEYEYLPMPTETIPPVGSNLLMHFFTHPNDAASRPVLLPSIPKRKRDKLEPCPVRGSSVGWGIDITTGTNELKLFLLGLLACMGSLLFGVVWTVNMGDIQGGFGAAGFMFALLGFTVASLKALDF
ncbi:hypothetical protein CC80DRAFT_466719 [Byssothecium circinans]|uniref:Uncharacterized protein n=1 Tax=Byssothecium circinans TaxID=147558 RepID=A0A6A5U476_9PLEO|nr:hypothetical protein CC80DRAFT_466719 [Byssothecium circinans]